MVTLLNEIQHYIPSLAWLGAEYLLCVLPRALPEMLKIVCHPLILQS